MTTSVSRPSVLGWAATVSLVAGAIGTLTLLFVSARSTPAILILLYTGWVLLPYVTLAYGRMRIASPSGADVMNIGVVVVVALALIAYVLAAVLPKAPRPAAVFLMVPLACQVLAAAVYAVAAARGRASSSQSKD